MNTVINEENLIGFTFFQIWHTFKSVNGNREIIQVFLFRDLVQNTRALLETLKFHQLILFFNHLQRTIRACYKCRGLNGLFARKNKILTYDIRQWPIVLTAVICSTPSVKVKYFFDNLWSH